MRRLLLLVCLFISGCAFLQSVPPPDLGSVNWGQVSVQATIPPAHLSTTPASGQYPEFGTICDVRPTEPGLQLYYESAIAYLLQADISSGQAEDFSGVLFQKWDGSYWVTLGAGLRQKDWPAGYYKVWQPDRLGNEPPDKREVVYFRAIAIDRRGVPERQLFLNDAPTLANGPGSRLTIPVWELQAILIDGEAPLAYIMKIGKVSGADLNNGAIIVSGQQVPVMAQVEDGHSRDWCSDVVEFYFEYAREGSDDWQIFTDIRCTDDNSLVGVIDDGLWGQKSWTTFPDRSEARAVWNTRGLSPGKYKLRPVAIDIEGNTSDLGIYERHVQVMKRRN